MLRIIKIVFVGLAVLIGIYFLANFLLRMSSHKRAAVTLAEVVATVDSRYCDMAVETLVELKDESVIPLLDAGLEAGNVGSRMRIIKVLEAYEGEVARDPLLSALSDTDEIISSRAALALARQGEYEVLELTRERLKSNNPQVVGLSFETIGYLEDGFIKRIEEELNSDKPDLMPSALRGLIPMILQGDDKAWKLLKRGITSRYEEVRKASLATAIGLGGEYRSNALMLAVESSDTGLRRKAVDEIVRGEDVAQFSDILKLALNDDDIDVKFAAAWGLYKLRDPEPVAHMRSILNNEEVSLHNRIIAARILVRMGDPHGADPMYDILDDIEIGDDLKLEAAEVLGEYEEIKGMGYLGEAIKPDRSVEVRRKALAMLGLMGDRNAGALLRDMLSDPDEEIAVRSAYALTALGDNRGTKKLKRFLRSDSPEVRTIAAVGILTGGDMTDIIGDEGFPS